jgi:ribosomal protein S18 acetylase RimI-like enzyme
MSNNDRQGLVKRQRLTEAEVAEIVALIDYCRAYDGLELKISFDLLRDRASDDTNDFLYYEADRLVGILSLDGAGSDDREAIGTVHPEYRRRGIGRALLTAANEACRGAGVEKLLLICEDGSIPGKAFAGAIGAVYTFSEHKMRLETFHSKSMHDGELQLVRIGPAETEIAVHVLAASFGQSVEEAGELTDRFLHDPHCRIYLIQHEQVPIGTFNLQFHEEVGLYGFGIIPAYRGRGYGRQALEQAIHTARAESAGPITLEAETDNVGALALYRSCGFAEVTTYQYYALPLATS